VEAGVSEEAFAAQHLFEFEVQAYEVSVAMEGHVVAIASPIMFAREIADGRLVQPFEHVTRDARAYYLAYPAAQRRAPKIAAFRAWILAQAHQQPAPAAISSAGR
jgi:LysR family glycine cleavage system transcriptional activator